MSNYRVPVMQNFSWQDPVISMLQNPASLTPTKGDRYLINGTGEGDWVGHDNAIAWYDGSEWQFDAAQTGWRCYVVNLGKYVFFNTTSWTDSLIVGDFEIQGDIVSPNESEWILKDNAAEALIISSTGMTGDLLAFDTTDGQEILSTDAVFQTNGILDINDDVSLETRATTFDLKQNETTAISFDTTSLAGLLSINTNSGEEAVNVGKDLNVIGDLYVGGTTTTINSEQMTVDDKLITVNKGNIASSAGGAGIEIEEAGVITGYVKTSTSRDGFVFKAPANGYVFGIDIDADSELTMAADLIVEEASAINQDVTTDAGVVFDSIKLIGANSDSIDLTTSSMDFDLKSDEISALSFDSPTIAGMLSFDTTVGNPVLRSTVPFNIGGKLYWSDGTTVSTDGADLQLLDADNNTVTVKEAKTAYVSRAKYDGSLGLIVFDEGALDLIDDI